VKRAADGVVVDGADAEVGAEVRAARVERPDAIVVPSEENNLAAEDIERLRARPWQIARRHRRVPARDVAVGSLKFIAARECTALRPPHPRLAAVVPPNVHIDRAGVLPRPKSARGRPARRRRLDRDLAHL